MNNIHLKQAIRGIKFNPSRTILTTLGITIGIATVIIVFASGEGFRSYVNNQVEVYGSNTVFIEVSVPSSTKDLSNSSENQTANSSAVNAVPITTLKNKDIEDVKKINNIVNAYGVVMDQQIVSFQDISKNIFVFGASASRFEIDKGELERGRPFSEDEDNSLSQVVILGNNLANDLFGEKDPIGQLIRIGNYNFEVIGVYAPKGTLGFDENNMVFVPLKTLQKKIMGIDYLLYAVVQLEDNNKAKITSLDMEEILRKNHYISDPSKDDFKVTTQEESMDIFNTILQTITLLLIAIATISLIVGGVGVMNIMYVIVTERISEIGLKKALGARNKDILLEFLIEAVILTLIGGILGIILGSFLAFIISKIAQSLGLFWKFTVPVSGVIISFSVSAIIGIIFGVFPARNASKLNPIEALNKE